MTTGIDLRPSHGGQLDLLKGDYPQVKNWLDLSTGVAPWSYPVSIDHGLDQLPSAQDVQTCETAMARSFDTRPEDLMVVPGLEIVIRLLPLILKGPLKIQQPTYGDYELAWQLNASSIATSGRVEVICQPNNPTGQSYPPDELTRRIAQAERSNGWLVVDESYQEASESLSALADTHSERLIVLKSFGKFYGLPGLRLGAVIAAPKILKELRKYLGEWRVGTLALLVGAEAYQDKAWQSIQKDRLCSAANHQAKIFEELGQAIGLANIGSTYLFQCLHHDNAEGIWRFLMEQGIYTRLFKDHNLLRIGVSDEPSDINRLRQALRFYLERNARN